MGLLDNAGMDSPEMGMAMGLLSAGGASRMPVSLGQGLAQGYQGYQQAQQMQQAQQARAMQMEQQKMQMAEAQKQQAALKAFRDQLPPQLQGQFDLDPKGFISALSKQQEEYTLTPGAVRYKGKEKIAEAPMKPNESPLPWYIRPGADGKTQIDPAYAEFEKMKAREARPQTPFYQFLPTADGYAVGNARSGQVTPATMGGRPIVKASDSPVLQAEIAGAKEAAKTRAEETTKAQLDAPRIIDNANNSIKLVTDLIAHPGFKQAVGKSSMLGVQKIPGTDAYDFMNRLDQIKGGAFLEAFNSLKGGGQITEVEGKKATEAITRMNNATSEPEFISAANDYIGVIRTAVNRVKMKARPVGPVEVAAPAKTGEVKFLGFE